MPDSIIHAMLLDIKKVAKEFTLKYDSKYQWHAILVGKDGRSCNFQNKNLGKVLDYLWNYFYEDKKETKKA